MSETPAPRPEAVFVGIATLDVIQRVSQPPQWGRKSVADSVEMSAGGPATNAAVTCARVLGSATLVTGVGSGPAADVVGADLRAHHVDIHDCAPPGRAWSVPVATAIVHPDGERTVVSTGATRSELGLSETARADLLAAKVLMLDGHHPGLAQAALEESPASQITVLDAGSAKPHAERWLPGIDVLAASADYASGLDLSMEQLLARGVRAGCRAVVVTNGARPTRWACVTGRSGAVQPPRVHAVDTLGAGDAFHGTLVAELAAAGPAWLDTFDDAVRAAVRVASVRVTHRGARSWLAHL